MLVHMVLHLPSTGFTAHNNNNPFDNLICFLYLSWGEKYPHLLYAFAEEQIGNLTSQISEPPAFTFF